MKKCDVCGVDETTNRIVKLRYKDEYYCTKHREQLKAHGKITDTSKPNPTPVIYCEVCGASSLETKVYKDTHFGKILCRRHHIQISKYGKVLEKTTHDRNDIIEHGDYIEIITKDVKGNITGSTFIDAEDYPRVKDYKIYKSREYVRICLPEGKKKSLHNFIMNCEKGKLVDHINSTYSEGILGTMDNRKSNLRIANTQKNAFNINKGIDKGVALKRQSRWKSSIMLNYKPIWLGVYDTKEEAIMARFIADVLLFKNFRNAIYDEQKFKIYSNMKKETFLDVKDNVLKFLNKKKLNYDINLFYKVIEELKHQCT